jgi:hypothetical protein
MEDSYTMIRETPMAKYEWHKPMRIWQHMGSGFFEPLPNPSNP